MPNYTGKLLGKVRVEKFLARGGMAEVYIGNHTTLHRPVAIKFLKADLQDNPDLRERFEREARAIAMLRHPNIVQVYDFDTFEDQPYLVMEYVPGTSLSSYLNELHKNRQRLDIGRINALLNKLASALSYAHNNNVVHRDIKPANILLTSGTTPISAGVPLPEDAEPIITDFGLVRFTQSNKQTSTGIITGTPAYMSPEQARGDQVDARTDVYSLAATVYEMLAGNVPFDSESTLSLLHMQIYDPPPPIDGISSQLQDVMDRALAKSPEDRFATPAEFAEAFQSAIAGTTEAATLLPAASLPSSNTPAGSSGTSTSRASRSLPVLFSAVGALVILAAGIIFVIQSRSQHVAPPSAGTTIAAQGSDPPALPIGVLRFQDGAARADQVTIRTDGMPLPPVGKQYEAWLLQDDNEQRISIGVISFDQNEHGSLTYIDPQGQNLIGLYHALEITLEPNPDNSTNPSTDIAYSVTLPPGGYMHVRHLLYSFAGNPNRIGFLDGLDNDTKLLNDLAGKMLEASHTGDDAGVKLQAEQMLNIILGNQSSDYKDWNNDGQIEDPGDGFGLLLNGDNLGYIQGTFTHANLSLTSKDATPNMLLHGGHVKIAATNVGEWTPELRDDLISIFESSAGTDTEASVRQAVALADKIRNGIDINGDEKIDPIPGEGGALTAYQHAYYMADMDILP